MDALKVRQLANSALAGFEDLRIEGAVEVALWNLSEILLHVADDPCSIALVGRIEGRIRGEGFFGDRKPADFVELKVSPLMAL